MEVQGGAWWVLVLADSFGAAYQLLGEFVGDVEGEVAAHDRHSRSGGHGGGIGDALLVADLADCVEVLEEWVGGRLLLEVEQEGGSKGQGVVAGCDDGDVVAAQDDGHDRNDGEVDLFGTPVFPGPLGDVVPGGGEGVGHNGVETKTHG